MTARALLLAVGVCVATPAVFVPPGAFAQPSGKDDLSKKSATELRDLGNKLFDEKQYNGALAAYREAYRRLPSVKILLNIGVTLNKLERFADAANAFQRYVEASDADPAMKPELEKVLVDIDKKVGVLELSITPPDAQMQVNNGDWVPARTLYRVPGGTVTINVKRDGYLPQTKPAQVAVGEKTAIPIALQPVPEKVRVEKVYEGPKPEGPRNRLGAMAMEHLDIPHKGAATRIGVTFDILDRLAVQAGALLGPTYGGYIGTQVALLTGSFRPIIAAGMPLFFSDGTRYGMRGAGGIELVINRHLALQAEFGVEYLVNPEMDIKELVFIPALGAIGRL